jgi:hypothetical protein
LALANEEQYGQTPGVFWGAVDFEAFCSCSPWQQAPDCAAPVWHGVDEPSPESLVPAAGDEPDLASSDSDGGVPVQQQQVWWALASAGQAQLPLAHGPDWAGKGSPKIAPR